jgi:hypothetical protein
MENNFPTHYLLKLISGDGDTSTNHNKSAFENGIPFPNASTTNLPANVHNKACWTTKGPNHNKSAFENGIPFPNASTTKFAHKRPQQNMLDNKGPNHKNSAFENGIPFPNASTTNLPTNVHNKTCWTTKGQITKIAHLKTEFRFQTLLQQICPQTSTTTHVGQQRAKSQQERI